MPCQQGKGPLGWQNICCPLHLARLTSRLGAGHSPLQSLTHLLSISVGQASSWQKHPRVIKF